MQGRQRHAIDSYLRVQAFLATHPVPPPASYSEPKAVLDDVVARLTDHSSAQVSGRQLGRSERRKLESLMQKLRDHHMRPVVRIAKLAIQPEPGVAEKLRMPRRARTGTELLAWATAMRRAATQYRDTFVANGLPADFLERFAAAEDAVTASMQTHGTNVGTKASAGVGMDEEIKRGRAAVDALDSTVQIAFEGDEVVLEAWRVAKRLKGVRSGGRLDGEPASTPVIVKPAA